MASTQTNFIKCRLGTQSLFVSNTVKETRNQRPSRKNEFFSGRNLYIKFILYLYIKFMVNFHENRQCQRFLGHARYNRFVYLLIVLFTVKLSD